MLSKIFAIAGTFTLLFSMPVYAAVSGQTSDAPPDTQSPQSQPLVHLSKSTNLDGTVRMQAQSQTLSNLSHSNNVGMMGTGGAGTTEGGTTGMGAAGSGTAGQGTAPEPSTTRLPHGMTNPTAPKMQQAPGSSTNMNMNNAPNAGRPGAATPPSPGPYETQSTDHIGYRATSTNDRNYNWSWLGVLGLFGLFGLAGRARNSDPER